MGSADHASRFTGCPFPPDHTSPSPLKACAANPRMFSSSRLELQLGMTKHSRTEGFHQDFLLTEGNAQKRASAVFRPSFSPRLSSRRWKRLQYAFHGILVQPESCGNASSGASNAQYPSVDSSLRRKSRFPYSRAPGEIPLVITIPESSPMGERFIFHHEG